MPSVSSALDGEAVDPLAVEEHLAGVRRVDTVMILISVDLPAPLSPSRPTTSPERSVKLMSFSTLTPPNDLETSRSSSRTAPRAGTAAEARFERAQHGRL